MLTMGRAEARAVLEQREAGTKALGQGSRNNEVGRKGQEKRSGREAGARLCGVWIWAHVLGAATEDFDTGE